VSGEVGPTDNDAAKAAESRPYMVAPENQGGAQMANRGGLAGVAGGVQAILKYERKSE
jgi:hypothetical protein